MKKDYLQWLHSTARRLLGGKTISGAFAAMLLVTGVAVNGWGQLTLPASSPYTQDFDGIGSGLPTGWTVRTGATAAVLGTTQTFNTTATSWATTTGDFRNSASADGLIGSANTATQSAHTDRALGVRQSGSFGDPGAAFVLQLANTSGKTGFSLDFKLQSLDAGSQRTVTWVVDYGLGSSPSSFTAVTTSPASITTGGSSFTNTGVSITLPAAIDNQSGNVWIRIVALTVSSGSNNRPTTGIDDVSLSWGSGSDVNVSNTGAPTGGDILKGATDAVVGGFQLDASVAVDFTGVNITTSGTAATSDLSNFRIFYDANSNGLLDANETNVSGIGKTLAAVMSFTPIIGQTAFTGIRRYLLIADVNSVATGGFTFTGSIAAATDVTSSGTVGGDAAGNTYTIEDLVLTGGTVTLAAWDFDPLTGGAGNWGPSPYTATVSNTNVVVGGLTRGSGVATDVSATASADAWGGHNFQSTTALAAESANKFVTFSVTPNTGKTISLSSIEPYNIRRSGSGPNIGQWQYQVGSGSFTDIGSAITWGSTITSAGNSQTAIDLTSIAALQNVSGTTVTFRVLLWGGTAAGGTWYFNDPPTASNDLDLIITGSVRSTYYPRTTATNLANLSHWTSDVTGVGGSSPTAFANDVFEVNNNITNPSFSGAWNITDDAVVLVTNPNGIIAEPGASLNVTLGARFDMDSKPFVLRSDATGTASIGNRQGATISNATNVTVERHLPAKPTHKNIFLALPIDGVSIANAWQDEIHITGSGTGGSVCPALSANSNGFDATTSNSSSFFTYNDQNTGSKWQSIPSTSYINNAGTGYRVIVRGPRQTDGCALLDGTKTQQDAVTLSATGSLKQNQVTVPLTPWITGGTYAPSLVGNPYPSAIDWDATGWTRDASIENAIVTYVPANTATSANGNFYSVYSLGSWTNNTGNVLANGIIASGQPFFVRTTSPTPVNLVFEEAYKSGNTTSGAFKATSVWDNLLRIAMKTDDSLHIDECIVRFGSNGTSSYNNQIDATAMSTSSALKLTSLKGQRNLAIQTRDEKFTDDTVKLNVTATPGNYMLAFSEYEKFLNTDIYLVDKYINNIQNVKNNNRYNYSVNTDSSTYGENRFEIVFVNNQTLSVSGKSNEISKLLVYPNPVTDRLCLRLTAAGNNTHFTVQVRNVQGQTVIISTAVPSNNEISVPASKLPAGVYYVEVSGDNGYKAVSKFIK